MEAKDSSDLNRDPFALGEFQIDARENTISGPGGRITIEPKIMAVLVILADHEGALVTRQEFLDTVWEKEFGGDESLTRAISQLRKVLKDGRGTNAIIETVPRRGYRLVAPRAGANSRKSMSVRSWLAVMVLLVLGVLLASFWLARAPGPDADNDTLEPVIAVLPFDSQSTQENDVFLAEGLADEILSVLTRSRAVSTIGGNSSFQFRGERKKELQEMVDKLGVTHILDGAVRRTDSSVRVGVHLIDALTGLTAWSEVVERPESEVYGLPPQIASSVLAALGKPRDIPEMPRPAGTPVASAYALYLQSRALVREPDSTALERAIVYLEEAIAQDPGLAEAWALLALSRLNIMLASPSQAQSGYRNRDPEARLSAARREARQALALDPDATDAQVALMIIDYRARLLPLQEAERRFRQVVDSAPDHAEANMRMGMLLNEVGRLEDSAVYLGRAAAMDPLALQGVGLYLQSLQHIGRDEEAMALIESGRCPWLPYSYVRLEHDLVKGNIEDAEQWVELAGQLPYFMPHGVGKLLPDNPQDPERLMNLLTRLVEMAEKGEPSSDESLPAEFIEAADDGLILHYYVALLLGAAGVMEPVNQLVLDRLKVDDLYFRGALFRPAFRQLRADPRTLEWFDIGTQLDYWLETEQWPDFCADPSLPYDCAEAAMAYREGSAP